jgi:predicted nucleic acid-binding protein
MEIMVDTSIIDEVILDQEKAEDVKRVIKDYDLVSPEVLPFEVGNSLSKKMIRKLMNGKQALEKYLLFKAMPIRFVETELERAIKIAYRYNSYAYDAYFLECADRLKIPLMTFDKKMKIDGKDMGITIVEAKDGYREKM